MCRHRTVQSKPCIAAVDGLNFEATILELDLDGKSTKRL
jgi:hypothetical protein